VYFVHKCFDITNLYNPFVVFFLYHTFFLFIALSYKEKYNYAVVISHPVIFLIISSYITTILGAVVSTLLFKKAGMEYFKLNQISYGGEQSRYSKHAGYIILLIGFALAIYYIRDTGGLLFFKSDMENARITDRKGRGLLTLMSIAFISFGFLISIFDRKPVLFKLFLFVVSCFFLIAFGNRATMLELSLMAFILFCAYKHRKIKVKYLVYIGAVIFCLLVFFGAIRAKSNYDVSDLFVAQFGWRPFVNIQNLQWIFDFFPKELPFLHGESMWIELKLFLPGSNPNFGTWLKDSMHLVFDGGSITTSHIGIAYLNFGYAGALLFPFFLSFVFQSIYIILIRREVQSKFKLVFMAQLALALGGTLSSGLMSVLITNVMFICFIACTYIFITYLLKLLGYMGKNVKEPDPQNHLH
jgi:oligosaccharide repeat unit polymerase